MAEVKILIEGIHKKTEEDKLKISSTITLIKTNKNILVDTGSFLDEKKIIEELKKENLSPKDIDIVVLTHLHLDHIINLHLFKNSKVFCKFRGGGYPGQVHFPKDGYLQRSNLTDGAEIADDVLIILTPGHSDDMISVVVDTNKGKIIVAGDAFPSEEFLDLDKQLDPLLIDVEEFNKSRKKVLEMADWVIPGHGPIFKVKKEN